MVEHSHIKDFSAEVCRYFLEFLKTDFKRQQAPRRRVQLKSDTGFRTGIPLRKYAKLYADVWELAAKPAGQAFTLHIGPRRYSAPVSSTLQDLIRQHVRQIHPDEFSKVRQDTLDWTARNASRAAQDPEKFVEEVQTAFVQSVGERMVAPLLSFLDGPFRAQAYSAIESVYDVEVDLTDTLTEAALPQIPIAVNSFIINNDQEPLKAVLDQFFSVEDVTERILGFFDDFATSDAFQELRDVMNYARTTDNLQFYLYLCDIHFGTATFPLFYIPAQVKYEESNTEYKIEFDPHLFVNKSAIDFIIQELRAENQRLNISPVADRILYLEENETFLEKMEKILRTLVPALDLTGGLDLRSGRIQVNSSAQLKVSNAAYFSVFDKSDEALINDYETLLHAVTDDQAGVDTLFLGIIRGFLLGNPKSFREKVADDWDTLSASDRLVANSPIPVNEEQRKILQALKEPDCNYLAIQGPPGTGKSHTITAIAFNSIMADSNVLILSDKQEALDVVQSKLEETLNKVRQGEDFPNPILRLGRTGGTYTRLISQSSQERIRQQYRAHRSHAETLEQETVKTQGDLKRFIDTTLDAYGKIKLSEMEELFRWEEKLEAKSPGCTAVIQKVDPVQLDALIKLAERLKSPEGEEAARILVSQVQSGDVKDLVLESRMLEAVRTLEQLRSDQIPLSLFTALPLSLQPTLTTYITNCENLRWPLVGFLFNRSKARALTAKLAAELPCANPVDLHLRLTDLKAVVASLGRIRQVLKNMELPEEKGADLYQRLNGVISVPSAMEAMKDFLIGLWKLLGNTGPVSRMNFSCPEAAFLNGAEAISHLWLLIRYGHRWTRVQLVLTQAPGFDYVGLKTKLEQLYTTRMSHEIDKRFIDFVDNNRTTAKTLGSVIKAKQKFPQESFESFKKAFPCIIAGIREFAEYVPLHQDLFDLVIIDEASQVSVAQAFPALLRAKKVIVFGDQKQFSNVKSAQASNILNAGHLTHLESIFRENISEASDKIQRLKQFDVKKSVLEFFDLIASYHDMLRKHFRGYQELISFSSEYFYDGQLQAIKVRGKPIEEVLRFSILAHDGLEERTRNVNSVEGDFILTELRRMVDEDDGLSVGIITPFREQQRHLTKLLFSDSYAERFEKALNLKVMTFDTCQGEERDLIIYSMVATKGQDLLNYIFPVTIVSAADTVEEKLKMQRLNVGFSRAKEGMLFVLSKPIEDFRGSIGRALMHYKNALDRQNIPEPEDTDPASPMEKKVLDWIRKTAFFQKNTEQLEIIAQFPIGEYLRQLDPSYHHPAYRCDFLLRYRGGKRSVNVVIEYDGFAEHFIEHKRIHEGNYDQLYRPEDLERQMVIESYGYKFLRINRFNVGEDPVQTLSERFYALIESAAIDEAHPVVAQIIDHAEGLGNGSARHCRKCGTVKVLEGFFDPSLKGGEGGHGQICMACKGQHKNTGVKSGHRFRWYGRRRSRR
ncbi:MAG: AAA family ATPase [Elusimicrobia bacterium]|nr:AAA family ATPase [Elusimicrobiota bacterium]